MNKKTWIVVVAVIVVALAGVAVWHYYATDSDAGSPAPAPAAGQQATSTSGTPAAPVAAAGGHCGGNMMNAPVCGTGYQCEPAPGSHLPFGDVGGICVAVQATGGAAY